MLQLSGQGAELASDMDETLMNRYELDREDRKRFQKGLQETFCARDGSTSATSHRIWRSNGREGLTTILPLAPHQLDHSCILFTLLLVLFDNGLDDVQTLYKRLQVLLRINP
jgi:hypothetical protein